MSKIEMPGAPGVFANKSAADKNSKMASAAKDMESVFITMLLKTMEKTIPENPYGESGNSMAKMMFSTVMGKAIADKGGIGLADFIRENMENAENGLLNKLNPLLAPDMLENLKSLRWEND